MRLAGEPVDLERHPSNQEARHVGLAQAIVAGGRPFRNREMDEGGELGGDRDVRSIPTVDDAPFVAVQCESKREGVDPSCCADDLEPGSERTAAMRDAKAWIDRLSLQPHPEGGYFRETYRSADLIEEGALGGRYPGPRSAGTGVLFLLTSEEFPSLHRLKSDEVWYFHAGSPITVHVIEPSGGYRSMRVGLGIDDGQSPQAVVTAGSWFGATVDEPGGFALVGCAVAPGFDFEDFELAEREALSKDFPQHKDLIARLTRR